MTSVNAKGRKEGARKKSRIRNLAAIYQNGKESFRKIPKGKEIHRQTTKEKKSRKVFGPEVKKKWEANRRKKFNALIEDLRIALTCEPCPKVEVIKAAITSVISHRRGETGINQDVATKNMSYIEKLKRHNLALTFILEEAGVTMETEQEDGDVTYYIPVLSSSRQSEKIKRRKLVIKGGDSTAYPDGPEKKFVDDFCQTEEENPSADDTNVEAAFVINNEHMTSEPFVMPSVMYENIPDLVENYVSIPGGKILKPGLNNMAPSNLHNTYSKEEIIIEGVENELVTVKLIDNAPKSKENQTSPLDNVANKYIIGEPVLIQNQNGFTESCLLVQSNETHPLSAVPVLQRIENNIPKVGKPKMFMLKYQQNGQFNRSPGTFLVPPEMQFIIAPSSARIATAPKGPSEANAVFQSVISQSPSTISIPDIPYTIATKTSRLKRIAPKPIEPKTEKVFVSDLKNYTSRRQGPKRKKLRGNLEDCDVKKSSVVYPEPKLKDISSTSSPPHDDLDDIDLPDDMPCVISEGIQNNDLETNGVTEEHLVQMLCSMEDVERGCAFSPPPPTDYKLKVEGKRTPEDLVENILEKSPSPNKSSFENSDQVSKQTQATNSDFSAPCSSYSIVSLCRPFKTGGRKVSHHSRLGQAIENGASLQPKSSVEFHKTKSSTKSDVKLSSISLDSSEEQKPNSSTMNLSVSSLISQNVPINDNVISSFESQPLLDLQIAPSVSTSVSLIPPSLYLHPPPFPASPLAPMGLPSLPLPPNAPVPSFSFSCGSSVCGSCTSTTNTTASDGRLGEKTHSDSSSTLESNKVMTSLESPSIGRTSYIPTMLAAPPTVPLLSTMSSTDAVGMPKSIFSLAPITSYPHHFPFCPPSLSDAPTTFSFTLTTNSTNVSGSSCSSSTMSSSVETKTSAPVTSCTESSQGSTKPTVPNQLDNVAVLPTPKKVSTSLPETPPSSKLKTSKEGSSVLCTGIFALPDTWVNNPIYDSSLFPLTTTSSIPCKTSESWSCDLFPSLSNNTKTTSNKVDGGGTTAVGSDCSSSYNKQSSICHSLPMLVSSTTSDETALKSLTSKDLTEPQRVTQMVERPTEIEKENSGKKLPTVCFIDSSNDGIVRNGGDAVFSIYCPKDGSFTGDYNKLQEPDTSYYILSNVFSGVSCMFGSADSTPKASESGHSTEKNDVRKGHSVQDKPLDCSSLNQQPPTKNVITDPSKGNPTPVLCSPDVHTLFSEFGEKEKYSNVPISCSLNNADSPSNPCTLAHVDSCCQLRGSNLKNYNSNKLDGEKVKISECDNSESSMKNSCGLGTPEATLSHSGLGTLSHSGVLPSGSESQTTVSPSKGFVRSAKPSGESNSVCHSSKIDNNAACSFNNFYLPESVSNQQILHFSSNVDNVPPREAAIKVCSNDCVHQKAVEMHICNHINKESPLCKSHAPSLPINIFNKHAIGAEPTVVTDVSIEKASGKKESSAVIDSNRSCIVNVHLSAENIPFSQTPSHSFFNTQTSTKTRMEEKTANPKIQEANAVKNCTTSYPQSKTCSVNCQINRDPQVATQNDENVPLPSDNSVANKGFSPVNQGQNVQLQQQQQQQRQRLQLQKQQPAQNQSQQAAMHHCSVNQLQKQHHSNTNSVAIISSNHPVQNANQSESHSRGTQQSINNATPLHLQQQQLQLHSLHNQQQQQHSNQHLQIMETFENPILDSGSERASMKQHSGQHHHSPMGSNSAYGQSFDYNSYCRKPSQSPRGDSQHHCYSFKQVENFHQDVVPQGVPNSNSFIPSFLDDSEEVSIREEGTLTNHVRGFSVSHLVSTFNNTRKPSMVGPIDQQELINNEEKVKDPSKKCSSGSRKADSNKPRGSGGNKGNSQDSRRKSPARNIPGHLPSNTQGIWNNKQPLTKQGQNYSAEALISSQNSPRPNHRQSSNHSYHQNQMYQGSYSSQQMKNFVQNPPFGYGGYDRNMVCNTDYNFHPQSYGSNMSYMTPSYPYQNLPSGSSSMLSGDFMSTPHHTGGYPRFPSDFNSDNSSFGSNANFSLPLDPQDMCSGSISSVKVPGEPPFNLASSPGYPKLPMGKNSSIPSSSGNSLYSSGKRLRYVDPTMMGSGMGTPTNFFDGSAISHISLHSFTPPCEDVMHGNFLGASSRHQSNFFLGSDNATTLNAGQTSGHSFPNVGSNGVLPSGDGNQQIPFNPLRIAERQQMNAPTLSSSLSNFNLTSIFPEIDCKADDSGSTLNSPHEEGPMTSSSDRGGNRSSSMPSLPLTSNSVTTTSNTNTSTSANVTNNIFQPSHQIILGINPSLSMTPSSFAGINFTPSEH